MAQPEAKLSRKIMAALRERGAWCFKVHGSEYQPAGIPDILGCYQGVLFGVESKMPGNRPSEIQKYRMAQIEKAGGICRVAYCVEDALAILDEIEEL